MHTLHTRLLTVRIKIYKAVLDIWYNISRSMMQIFRNFHLKRPPVRQICVRTFEFCVMIAKTFNLLALILSHREEQTINAKVFVTTTRKKDINSVGELDLL